MNKFPIAALAALFALGSSSAIIFTSAQQSATPRPGILASQPGIALADKDDEGDQGDEGHHDNGKHKGWYKHHKSDNDDKNSSNTARSLRGTVTGINGNQVTIRQRNGQYVTINDQNALNSGMAPSLFVGESVRLAGSYGNNGVFYANSIAQTSTNTNTYANNGTCGTNYGGQIETVVGYATGGLDGNGNFGLQTSPVQNIPIPVGPRYTVHVNGSTCLNGQRVSNVQLDLGRHIKVSGVSGGGSTINATNIWYV